MRTKKKKTHRRVLIVVFLLLLWQYLQKEMMIHTEEGALYPNFRKNYFASEKRPQNSMQY